MLSSRAVCAPPAAGYPAAMSRRPNFILFITDQHRADHLGCYGNAVVDTPNIDTIAAHGTRFDRFYVANPVCMPNRASLMTGRMPSAHGVRHNGIPLARDHVTFVELLAAAGYDTALIGKSHLQNFTGKPARYGYAAPEGLTPPPEALQDARKRRRAGPAYEAENQTRWKGVSTPYYGFGHAEVCTGHGDEVGGDYLDWLREKGGDPDKLVGPRNALPDNTRVAPQAWRTAVPEDLYPTRYVAERACHYLAARKDTDAPFFLQVSFPDPHHPFTPPGRFWDMYDPAAMALPENFNAGGDLLPVRHLREALAAGTAVRDLPTQGFAVSEAEARTSIALTYGMITMVDEAVGRVRRALADAGLAEETVVMFTSDHGDYMGAYGLMTKYRLHVQGLIRVPFIWTEPQGTGGESRNDLATAIDIAPTVLARAGLAPFNGCQGRDLLSSAAPAAVLVEEDAVTPMFGESVPARVRTLVTDRWRLSFHQGPDWWELYDLAEDPFETTNLWNDEGARAAARPLVEEMVARLVALQDVSPLPTGRA